MKQYFFLVLAKFTTSAQLRRVWASIDSGTLAFYFCGSAIKNVNVTVTTPATAKGGELIVIIDYTSFILTGSQ
jgi:hypothetical protein